MHKLTAYRLSKRMTQANLAKMLRTTKATISRWEAGKRKPSLSQALAIVKATNGKVTVQDLHDARIATIKSVHGQ